MGTYDWGHEVAAGVAASSRRFSRAFCWILILAEILFPLSLAAPPHLLFAVLAAFLVFHVSNALFMGLNSFVFPFAATYPSVVIANELIGISVNALG